MKTKLIAWAFAVVALLGDVTLLFAEEVDAATPALDLSWLQAILSAVVPPDKQPLVPVVVAVVGVAAGLLYKFRDRLRRKK